MMTPATRAAINTALAAGEVNRAVAIADTALAAGERDALLFNLAAWAQEEAGDFAAAQDLLHRALALAPNDPLIHSAMGRCLSRQGRLSEAVRAFDAAIALDPDAAEAWTERGSVLEAGGSLRLATESYHNAARRDPHAVLALAGIASIASRQGEWDMARDFGARALAVDPGNGNAICAMARADIAAGDSARAAAALEQLLAHGAMVAELRSVATSLLGDARGRMGQPAAAFEAYAAANAQFARMHAWHFAGDTQAIPHSAMLARISDGLAATTAADWTSRARSPAPGEAERHVFLLGFPRSGTTLVENVLASAPGVEALEERPTLGDADRAYLVEEGGLAKLLALDDAGLAGFRAAYWQKVADAGVSVTGRSFVDMDPLKGSRLPLIARLFPAARVVLMRRDPRDVVWSCFRANFVLTSAAYEFTTLERTARLYAAMMELTEAARAKLPLAIHELRYEDLVSDFDATVQRLCAFTGIEWTPAMRRFDQTAARRDVATASVGQVRRPLYDGSGQWRRYVAQLESVMPILAPWVAKFGYAD